jgi:hypothetical protein
MVSHGKQLMKQFMFSEEVPQLRATKCVMPSHEVTRSEQVT